MTLSALSSLLCNLRCRLLAICPNVAETFTAEITVTNFQRLLWQPLLHYMSADRLHLHVAEDDMFCPVQGIYADLVPAWYAQVGQSLTIVIVFTVGLPHPAFVLYR